MPQPLNSRSFAMSRRHCPAPHGLLAQAARGTALAVVLAVAACLAARARAAQPLAPAVSWPASQVAPGASTQTAEAAASEATQRAAERRQIETQRRNLDAAHVREQAACLHRFFVNDCLDRARRRYNKQSDALDARLNAIDLAGRRQRADAERRRVAQNVRERPMPDASAVQQQRLWREQDQARKQREQADRAAGDAARQAAYEAKQQQAQARGPLPSAALPKAVSPGANAQSAQQASQQAAQRSAQIRAAEAAYAQKQADYQRRQAQAAQQREQAKPSGSGAAAPLPLPPGY